MRGKSLTNTAFIFQTTQEDNPRVIVGLATEVVEQVPEEFKDSDRRRFLNQVGLEFRSIGLLAEHGKLAPVVSKNGDWEKVDLGEKFTAREFVNPSQLKPLIGQAQSTNGFQFDKDHRLGFKQIKRDVYAEMQRLF